MQAYKRTAHTLTTGYFLDKQDVENIVLTRKQKHAKIEQYPSHDRVVNGTLTAP